MKPWSFSCSDALAPWRSQILSEMEAARAAIGKLVSTPGLSVELRHTPGRVIPEIGLVQLRAGAALIDLMVVGAGEPQAVAPDEHIGPFREYRVEVRRYNYARSRRATGTLCDDVAFFIRSDSRETDLFESPRDFSRARCFLERRCGYLADPDQFLVKLNADLINKLK